MSYLFPAHARPMTMGLEPMSRIDFMSVRLGMLIPSVISDILSTFLPLDGELKMLKLQGAIALRRTGFFLLASGTVGHSSRDVSISFRNSPRL